MRVRRVVAIRPEAVLRPAGPRVYVPAARVYLDRENGPLPIAFRDAFMVAFTLGALVNLASIVTE